MTTNSTNWSDLLTKIKSFPVWAKIVSVIVVASLSAIMFFTSCGTPRTVVTVSDGGSSVVEQNTTSTTTTTVTVRTDSTSKK